MYNMAHALLYGTFYPPSSVVFFATIIPHLLTYSVWRFLFRRRFQTSHCHLALGDTAF